jgi:hypothetical protein
VQSGVDVLKPEPTEDFYSVPIRRTRWTSFWIGVASAVLAFISAALLAAALVCLLVLLKVNGEGTVVVIVFGFLWFGLFFLSFPLQRRYARSFDLRRPGIRLADGVLVAPLPDGSTLHFKLDEPHELSYGWWDTLVPNVTGPTTNARVVVTYATLSQAGQQLFLIAEDSIREAWKAGWLRAPRLPQSKPDLRLWAGDIVTLVETMRTRSR